MKLKFKFIFIYLLMVGCSNTVVSDSSGPGNSSSETPINLDIQAVVFSGPFEGRIVINHVRNSLLEVLMPIGVNSFVPVGPFESPENKLQGQVLIDAEGFKTLRLLIPYSYVLRGVNRPGRSILPNGDSVSAFFNSAEIPAISFNLDPQGQSSVHFYSSPPSFGVFIQTPFELSASRPYQVNLGTSFTQIGSVTTHAPTNDLNGGLFLFISLPL